MHKEWTSFKGLASKKVTTPFDPDGVFEPSIKTGDLKEPEFLEEGGDLFEGCLQCLLEKSTKI